MGWAGGFTARDAAVVAVAVADIFTNNLHTLPSLKKSRIGKEKHELTRIDKPLGRGNGRRKCGEGKSSHHIKISSFSLNYCCGDCNLWIPSTF